MSKDDGFFLHKLSVESLLHFRIMTDGHNKLTHGFIVINAIDHAASAERQTDSCVILKAARHRVTELEEVILIEYQAV